MLGRDGQVAGFGAGAWSLPVRGMGDGRRHRGVSAWVSWVCREEVDEGWHGGSGKVGGSLVARPH